MDQETGIRAGTLPGQAVELEVSPIVTRRVFRAFGVGIGGLIRRVGPEANV
jgi:hypothetical protein